MPAFKNLTGQRFNRWTVIERGPNLGRHVRWLCRCDCGTRTLVASTNLTSGKSRSCGCLHVDVITTHGESTSDEYRTWAAMKARCYTESNIGYRYYGARGITVCDRWLHSFENFFADMGRRPSPEHSLDRIDPDSNYTPDNCRWALRSVQDNNRRDNRPLTFHGKTQTVAQWARELGMSKNTITNRLNWGWPVDEALTWSSEHGRVNPHSVRPS